MRVGRLPVLAGGWEDAQLDYMLSGGYSPSSVVSTVSCPTLVLWGSDDCVLPKDFPQR
jgi:hypothetical protein